MKTLSRLLIMATTLYAASSHLYKWLPVQLQLDYSSTQLFMADNHVAGRIDWYPSKPNRGVDAMVTPDFTENKIPKHFITADEASAKNYVETEVKAYLENKK